MQDFSISVDIDAPPDRVWAVMRDVERWAEWTPSIRSVTLLGGGPLAPGKRAFIRQPKLPPAVWRVTELDDGARTFTWSAPGPAMRVSGSHTVEVRGSASRATLALHYSGPLGDWFARRTSDLNHRYLALEANGLKQRAER